jgi:hypothetical protein
MQHLADYLVRLVRDLDTRPTRTGPVGLFEAVELKSLTRLLGKSLPLIMTEGISGVIRRFGL